MLSVGCENNEPQGANRHARGRARTTDAGNGRVRNARLCRQGLPAVGCAPKVSSAGKADRGAGTTDRFQGIEKGKHKPLLRRAAVGSYGNGTPLGNEAIQRGGTTDGVAARRIFHNPGASAGGRVKRVSYGEARAR